MVLTIGDRELFTASILGSTGSIGRNTIDVLQNSSLNFNIRALTAYRNVDLLAQQAISMNAEIAVIGDEALYPKLKAALAGTSIKAAAGHQAIVDAASIPVDWTMAAIVGAAGLEPTLAAIRQGKTVALANKECLVCAGSLMMEAVDEHNAFLIPVDSEHSAIFQFYEFDPEEVESITLTASGGPFYKWDKKQLASVTPEQAIKHPNWDMGAKISVDSATMVNKGLELIEAFHLFDIPPEELKVVIHPESIIHGLVTMHDGAMLAHMGVPDMRLPIAYALGFPSRLSTSIERLDLTKIGALHFEAPDESQFPALKIAKQLLHESQAACISFNAANEEAVQAFLAGQIGFLDITRLIDETLQKVAFLRIDSVEAVLAQDYGTRALTQKLIASSKQAA